MGPDFHVDQTKYVGIIVQSSLKGKAISKGWGTFKTGCNLIDYLDFSATKSATGGKGGAQASYTYKATLVLAICQGPIAGVRTIYKDSAIFTATPGGSKEVNGTTVTFSAKSPEQAAGITQIFTGATGQPPWSYLSGAHAAHALGYSGIAYAGAYHYPMNGSATAPNHNFEVQSPIRATVNGAVIDDANPADIVADLVPGVPRWPAGALADLTSYRNYCQATGLFLSPLADEGRQASDLLSEILKASNSDCFWSDGQLNITPYGDVPVTGNGVTWTPDLTPIYDLDYDDLIPNSPGEDPIQWDQKRPMDAYNYVQVGFLDRSQQYAADTATAIDQASINTFGKRQAAPVSLNSICDARVAAQLAQLMVQRSANIRRTAQFHLSELYGLLDPMDVITVPTPEGGRRLAMVTEANEQEDGTIEVTVEEILQGVSHAAEYSRQDGLGIPANFAVDPGDANPPVILNPPLSLTNGQLEVWIVASGGPSWGGATVWSSLDNETYQQVGQITQTGRYGVTTTDFPAGSDPDTAHSVGVNLAASGATLTPGSQADADAEITLCALGSEIIAYSAATLTGANAYTLGTYIRRGLAGTTIADQPAGSEFVRLDDSVLAIPYSQAQVGNPLYVKLQSFNLYGQAYQDLSLCEAYTFTAQQNGTTSIGVVQWSEIAGIPAALAGLTSTGGHIDGQYVQVPGQGAGSQPQALDQWAIDAYDNMVGATNAANQAAADVLTNAQTFAQQTLQGQAFQAYQQSLNYLDGVSLGTAIQTVQTQYTQGQSAIVSTLALLGAKSADSSAFVISGTTLQVSPGQSLVQAFDQTNQNVGAVTTDLATETSSRISGDSTLQSQIDLIGASNSSGSAFVINSSSLQLGDGQSLASTLTSLGATVGQHTTEIQNIQSVTNGLSGQAILSIDSNGHVTGYDIIGSSSGGAFTVLATQFAIINNGGATPFVPFSIDSNGVVHMSSVVVDQLAVGAVSTASLQANAVTNGGEHDDTTGYPLGNINASPAPQVCTYTYQSTGKAMHVDVNVGFVNTSSNHDQNVTVAVYDNGNLIKQYWGRIGQNSAGIPGGAREEKGTFFRYDSAQALTPGQHQFVVEAQVIGGTNNETSVYVASVRVVEFKDQSS